MATGSKTDFGEYERAGVGLEGKPSQFLTVAGRDTILVPATGSIRNFARAVGRLGRVATCVVTVAGDNWNPVMATGSKSYFCGNGEIFNGCMTKLSLQQLASVSS